MVGYTPHRCAQALSVAMRLNMFERFQSHFRADHAKGTLARGIRSSSETTDSALEEFLLRYGGYSFNGGIYRVLAVKKRDK